MVNGLPDRTKLIAILYVRKVVMLNFIIYDILLSISVAQTVAFIGGVCSANYGILFSFFDYGKLISILYSRKQSSWS